jgi:hypothetical protein
MGEFHIRERVDCEGVLTASTGGMVEALRREVKREVVEVEGRCRRDVRSVERAKRRANEGEGGAGGILSLVCVDRENIG